MALISSFKEIEKKKENKKSAYTQIAFSSGPERHSQLSSIVIGSRRRFVRPTSVEIKRDREKQACLNAKLS